MDERHSSSRPGKHHNGPVAVQHPAHEQESPDVGTGVVRAGELIVVSSRPELRSMLAYLRLERRTEPVVGLTSVAVDGDPLLSYEQVSSVVGNRARVYFVPTDAALRRLREGLGQKLALRAGGIRIWWPGLGPTTDPDDHPVVFPVEGESGVSLLGEFARVFHVTQPDVRREIGYIDGARALAEDETAAAKRRAAAAEHGMQQAHRERNEAVLRAEQAEADAERVEDMDADLRLHTLIAREWRRALTVTDRREHPLRYILSQRFVEAVARRPQMDVERLAWGCAMVACGYAAALKGLAPHQLRTGAMGSAQCERESDCAKAWRCRAPGAQGGGAPRMHYWVLPNQIIEFDDLGEHDDLKA